MKPTKPEYDESEAEEQYDEQPEEPQGPEAPVEATQRDVMKAEGKAEQAQEVASDAKRLTIEESKDLRDRLAEANEEIEQLREELVVLDQQVHGLFERAATQEGEPPLNPDMPYCCSENRDDDLPVEEAMQEATDDE
jgi:predicted  nucleic acid-binding Zn-ribbon protein